MDNAFQSLRPQVHAALVCCRQVFGYRVVVLPLSTALSSLCICGTTLSMENFVSLCYFPCTCTRHGCDIGVLSFGFWDFLGDIYSDSQFFVSWISLLLHLLAPRCRFRHQLPVQLMLACSMLFVCYPVMQSFAVVFNTTYSVRTYLSLWLQMGG